MRDNEKRFRALIENSTDGIVLLNAEGTILYDSPSVVFST
ncbi:MAG: PAS domain S-box protein [Bacteroidetes bacterium]|nr:PAS domain S-box protein [Bacteroidota bacterium]